MSKSGLARQQWLQRRPSYAIHLALKSGELVRQPCEKCGTTERIHAHHDDYSKPLVVRWLCQKHHNQYHARIRRLCRALRENLRVFALVKERLSHETELMERIAYVEADIRILLSKREAA